jgi:hypothetical protein
VSSKWFLLRNNILWRIYLYHGKKSDRGEGAESPLSVKQENQNEKSCLFSISARVCGTCSDRHRFSPVRREGHDDERSDDVCSVYELPEDFNVSYDNMHELSDDGEVHELSDDGEVHELSDDHLEVLRLRDSQTRCGVSYVSACVTPYALKAITYRSRDRV